ncbi:hypothetical protein GCM10018954_018990 [Kutzneria kofuensis]|uniref:Uncharacterized protein n=1 Tax=Amycolatopsis rubida TaxID=112413 RepID=A0A1I5WKY6_9PSEU|nr:hypothetical protein SAMN05421854_109270 [Amycolatopsis rubida]
MARHVTITGTCSVPAEFEAQLAALFDDYVRPFAGPDAHFYLGGAGQLRGRHEYRVLTSDGAIGAHDRGPGLPPRPGTLRVRHVSTFYNHACMNRDA